MQLPSVAGVAAGFDEYVSRDVEELRLPTGMTLDQYNSIGQKLNEEAGTWPPAGLLAHVCFDAGGGLHVSEVCKWGISFSANACCCSRDSRV